MEFLSHKYREEWERLQVELLQAQVEEQKEKARSLRLMNNLSDRTSSTYQFPNPDINYKTSVK